MSRFDQSGSLCSIEVGQLRVSYVPDGVVKTRPETLFPSTTEADWADLSELVDETGCLTVSMGASWSSAETGRSSWTPGPGQTRKLSPTLTGNRVGLRRGLLESLAALGREPSDVEAIAVTHLHMEHTGWLGQPAFEHAPILLTETEWVTRESAPELRDDARTALGQRSRFITPDDTIFPGVTAVSLPGHTPGQIGFVIASEGACVFADVLHSPAQVRHPHWPVLGEHDVQLGGRVRLEPLRRLADSDDVGFGIHLADVGVGWVRRSPGGLAREPLDSLTGVS